MWFDLISIGVEMLPPPVSQISPLLVPRSESQALTFAPTSLPLFCAATQTRSPVSVVMRGSVVWTFWAKAEWGRA